MICLAWTNQSQPWRPVSFAVGGQARVSGPKLQKWVRNTGKRQGATSKDTKHESTGLPSWENYYKT